MGGEAATTIGELTDARAVEQGALPPALRRFAADLATVTRWARDFLCAPNAALGREGLVCPYTKSALEKGTFWLTAIAGARPDANAIAEAALAYGERFSQLEPRTGLAAQFKTILIVFPEMSERDAPAIIDGVQHHLKPDFVARGLMLGQFYATCDEPGLWNPAFRPLRSPVPLLAIRQLVPSDFPFLTRSQACVAAYLRTVGERTPQRLRAMVREVAASFGLRCPVPVGRGPQ